LSDVIESLASVLPRRIAGLGRLAPWLWWTWQPEAQRMFRYLDRSLWEQIEHNPVRMLRQVHRKRLSIVSRDKRFLAIYDGVHAAFVSYKEAKPNGRR